MKSKRFNKLFKRFTNYKLMGGYIKRYCIPYIVLLFVVAFFELSLFARELFLIRSIPLRHTLYLVSYSVLFVASVASGIFLLTQRKKKDNEKLITLIIHIYAFIGLVWGVSVSLLDYWGGNEFPAVFFTILATIGGLLVLNPFIYAPIIVSLGAGMVVGMYFINPTLLTTGNVINITILYIMICIVSYRTTAVAVSEEDQRKVLTKLSNLDVLTGLKNENAYYRYLDKLDQRSKEEDIRYAVILMDVNGLKYTDDTFGHQYGAHLIHTAGQILPTVFNNSEIFHTGGDEFVAVIEKEIDNLDEMLKDFSEKLEYQLIEYQGQQLFLSLARGVAIHEPGEKYNDTYQRADKDMYKNKPTIKAKYNIQGR